MNISPWILGVAALVPVTGALIGKNISTEPIGTYADVTTLLPDNPHDIAAPPLSNTHERPPDHYALETPQGRIEVSELAWHGRFRDHMRHSYFSGYDKVYEAEAQLARVDARWDIEASANHAATRLPSSEPQVTRYPQAPHYAAMEQARTGESAAQPAPLPGNMRVVSINSQPVAAPRRIDVGVEMALNQ